MELFKILGTIALDGASEFNDQVDSAAQGGRSLAQTLGHGLGTAAKIGGAAIVAVGTAVVAGTKAIIDGARETAAYGDHIDKMSQKIGISAEAYQQWDFVMGQCGMSIDQMQVGMKQLSEAAVSGNAAFDKLGISQGELANLGTEDLFNRTVDALAGMEAGAERTALATDLFGRSATDMMPLLNAGADGIAALKQQAIDYGLILTDETIAASAAFTDSLTLMSKTFQGLKNRMMAEFLPSLTQVTDGLALLFQGDMSGLDVMNQGITDFVNHIAEAVPEMLSIGVSILSALAGAIIENLPTLLASAAEAIGQLVTAFIDALPMIIDVGIQIVDMIISGLSSAWDGLTSLAGSLWESVTESVTSAADGMVTALQDKFDAIQAAASNIWETIKSTITDKIDAAKDGVSTAIDAIKGFFNFSWSFPHIPLPHLIYDLIEIPLLGQIPNPLTLSVAWYKNGGIMTDPTAFGVNGNQLMVGGEAGAEAIAPIDLLQGYVAEAVASQNAGITDALEKILNAINKMNAEMGANMADALDGTQLSINHREFGRLVRGAI